MSSVLLSLSSSSAVSAAFNLEDSPFDYYSTGSGDFVDSDLTVAQRVFEIFLRIVYTLLCFISTVQVSRTILHRHKIKSFRFGFLALSCFWTFLRVIFWFVVDLESWPVWLSSTIYFLPASAQIATFALLILFYAKLAHRTRWTRLRRKFISFYVIGNTTLTILTVLFAALIDRAMATANGSTTDSQSQSDAQAVRDFVVRMYFICSALSFLTLVGIGGFYIRKLHHLRGLAQQGTSKTEIFVTSLIFLIFLSRAIFNFLFAFNLEGSNLEPSISETTDSHVKAVDPPTFVLLILWEILPTLMVIVYFRNIPATPDSYCLGLFSICGAFPIGSDNTEKQGSVDLPGKPSISDGDRHAMVSHNLSPSNTLQIVNEDDELNGDRTVSPVPVSHHRHRHCGIDSQFFHCHFCKCPWFPSICDSVYFQHVFDDIETNEDEHFGFFHERFGQGIMNGQQNASQLIHANEMDSGSETKSQEDYRNSSSRSHDHRQQTPLMQDFNELDGSDPHSQQVGHQFQQQEYRQSQSQQAYQHRSFSQHQLQSVAGAMPTPSPPQPRPTNQYNHSNQQIRPSIAHPPPPSISPDGSPIYSMQSPVHAHQQHQQHAPFSTAIPPGFTSPRQEGHRLSVRHEIRQSLALQQRAVAEESYAHAQAGHAQQFLSQQGNYQNSQQFTRFPSAAFPDRYDDNNYDANSFR